MTTATTSSARYAEHQSRLSGIAMVLKAAEAANLPAPFIVPTVGPMHVSTKAEYDAWAAWLDGDSNSVYRLGRTKHHVHSAEKFETSIRIVWIEDVEATA